MDDARSIGRTAAGPRRELMSEQTPNNAIPKDTPAPIRSWKQRLLALGMILILLLVGVAISQYLLKTSPKAERKPPAKMQTLVNTMDVAPVSKNVTIKALGRVVAAQEINIQARVSGQVVYLHPDFVPGGIIRKGETLVRIDDTDYKLILKQKQNGLALKKADMRIEEGSQTVARKEWELINQLSDDIDQSSEDLALRKPQLAKAYADLQVVETALEKAEIDLERTVIKAPFNGIVRVKNVDLGSEISNQSSIGILTGTDIFWADISLPVEKLKWLELPGKDRQGSSVRVWSGPVVHEGRIISLQSELDKDGLMARILIEIDDPMGLKKEKTPLLLADFVRAEIKGKKIENVIRIPRFSLRENNQVFIATADETLHIQPVSVLWKDSDFVFIDKGLAAGNQIIISNISSPIEGMFLKIDEKQKTGNNKAARDNQ